MDRDGYGVVATALLLALVAATASTGAAPSSPLVGTSQTAPDNVLLRAHLQPDGSAVWEVEYLLLLEDDNATAAFESLRRDIEANRSRFEAQFASRMRPTVESAENATGREMAIRNVRVSTDRQTIGQNYGVVTYRFEWTSFAAVDGERMRAGDALVGLFLDAETSLRITWPEEYRRVEVAPEPHDAEGNAVVWKGRFSFADDEPLVVVTSEPETTETGTTAASTTPGGPPDGGGFPSALFAIVAVTVLAAVGAAGWLYTRRDGEASTDGPGDGSDSDGDGDGSGGGGGEPPEELLSNEERVLRLLSEHGGRMKQQDVAAELDWTDAKTSQVVSSLREDDEVESFRLGRENVLTLPDHDLGGGAGDEEGEEE